MKIRRKSSGIQSPLKIAPESPMICVECGEYVESLYTEYNNGYIKLTDCPQCSKTADKYIEYDNVLLFIDILLLKPEAYKHLVFNVVSQTRISGTLKRLRLLAILFEIYLTWAYSEKKFNSQNYINPYLVYHSILQKHIVTQYFFFALKTFTEDVVAHKLVHYYMLDYLKWQPKGAPSTHQRTYLENVLSFTILISGGTKLFPILMLIWPYDNITITSIISSIASFTLVDSLMIVTNCGIYDTALLVILITVVKFTLTRMILIVLLTGGSATLAQKYALAEYHEVISQSSTAFNVFKSILG